MIVRKEDYKVHEAAFLLDLPARTVLALCDANVIACSRVVANGSLQQRKRRSISHCEIVRFNQTRAKDHRVNLASRLIDPSTEQSVLPFVEPEYEQMDEESVWVSKAEWRMVVAAINALAAKHDALKVVADKIGAAGVEVVNKGLRVRNYGDLAA